MALSGKIIFSAICADPEQLINLLKATGVMASNLRMEKGVLTGEIAGFSYSRLLEAADTVHAQVSVSKRKGVAFAMLRYRKRYGILVGAILALGLVFYFSNTVLKIELEGELPIPEEKALILLRENGVKPGAFIPSINMKEVESSLIRSDALISWVGIRSSGGRIVAEIEGLKTHEKLVPRHIPSNIIAARDAQIVSTEAYTGRVAVKRGDIVEKGDMLVSGTYTDAHGEVWLSHSNGHVIGRYTEKTIFSQVFEELKVRTSDEVIHKNALCFFGLEIPLWLGRLREDYILEEDYRSFKLFGLELPVGIRQKSYRLKESYLANFDAESAEAEVMKKIKDYEDTFLKDVTVVSRDLEKNIRENNVDIIVCYVLEGEIGKNVEIAVS